MRKFFTLIGAALLSVTTLHATSFTQNVDLSVFQMYPSQGKFDASTLEFSELVAWGGGQIWYGDDNASALDAGEYAYIGMDLAAVAANDVRLAVEYTPADGHDAQTLVIKAGKTSHLLKLNGRYIKKLEIVNHSGTSNASFTLNKVYFFKIVGKESETHLRTSDYALDGWGWEDRLQLTNTLFDAVHEGDKIVVTYTSKANDAVNEKYVGAQVRINNGANSEFTDVIESEMIQESQTNKEYEIILREADIDALKTNGMYIKGNMIVINKVDLYTYAQHVLVERTLSTGHQTLAWEGVWAHWDDIPTVYEGDELRVAVVANDGKGDYQINFRYDWVDGHQLVVDGVDGTTSKIYSRPLSASEAEAINATHDLLITGTGLTISRFAIAQSMSIYDDNMLWRGETAVTTWGNPVPVSADKFANMTVGDVINVSLSSVTNGGQLWITKSDATPFTPKPHYIFNSNYVAPLTISCVINQDMLNDLQASGMLICGADFTITSVHVIEAAERVESYTLTVTEAGMATLVLPFNVPYLPDGVEAYSLTNDGSDEIEATQVNAIEADKPVLIIAPAANYIFYSEKGANTDISGKYAADQNNYTNGAMVGNYFDITVPTTNPQAYNYILQKGAEGVGFYKVTGDPVCTLAPYRAYLSCGYNAMESVTPAPMRIRFREDTTTGVENAQAATDVQKLLIDGQLYILRDGVTYTIQGQIVK